MNLAEVMRSADKDSEPERDQRAVLDGEFEVQVRCVLERTAVIDLADQRVLVALHRLDVDEHALRWQPKVIGTAKERHFRQRAKHKSRPHPKEALTHER